MDESEVQAIVCSPDNCCVSLFSLMSALFIDLPGLDVQCMLRKMSYDRVQENNI